MCTQKLGMQISIAALFLIGKKWKKPQCLSRREEKGEREGVREKDGGVIL